MSLLRNRGGGLLAAGPAAIRSAASQRQNSLLKAARSPNVISAPSSVIQRENPLNSIGPGLAQFGQSLAAQKQKKIQNELARQKAEREGLLANSLINSRKSQEELTRERNEIQRLGLRQSNLLTQLQEVGKNERQRAALKAELERVKLQIGGRLDVANKNFKNSMVTTLTPKQAADAGFSKNDVVQIRPNGEVILNKDARAVDVSARPNMAPIYLPKDINFAELSGGIGRIGELGNRALQLITGSSTDSEPATEGLTIIDGVNNRAVNTGQSVAATFGGKLTNFARKLTRETMPRQDFFNTPAQYAAQAEGTAKAFIEMSSVLEGVLMDPSATREEKRMAKIRLPEVNQFAEFYTRLSKQVTGGASKAIQDADVLVFGNQ